MNVRAVLAGLVVLAGCFPNAKDVLLSFQGRPSYGAFYADTRQVLALCPSCGTAVRWEAACCGVVPRFPVSAPCSFCSQTGRCDPCAAFDAGGTCRQCGGSGKLESLGSCFACRGTGLCVACGGGAACDACGGSRSLSLPWRPSPPAAVRAPSRPGPPLRPDRYVIWCGESVTWSGPAGDAFRADHGTLVPEGKQLARIYSPEMPGSYELRTPKGSFFFEVVDLILRGPASPAAAAATPLAAALETSPRLRDPSVRWEVIRGGAPIRVMEGALVTARAEGPGRHELWPILEIPGLPILRGPRPVIYAVSDLRIVAPGTGPLRAGVPLAFRAEVRPPLPEEETFEWTLEGPGGPVKQTSRGAAARLTIPKPGAWKVTARTGALASDPLEVSAFGVEILAAEARIGESFQVAVDDASAQAFLSVATRRRDGTPLNPPVTYALEGTGPRRMTRPILLVGDRTDDRAGDRDDAPEDPTMHAVVGGTVEVTYRDRAALTLPVGPLIVHEIPVRFVSVRPSGEGGGPTARELDARLEPVNEVWERHGLRFVRGALETAAPPENLALVSGRAAGVDEHGHPARAGLLADGVEISVPTAWRETPGATARALGDRLGTFELHEKLFAAEPEAVVLKLKPRLRLERLAKARDVAQSVTLLAADLRDGCEVSAGGGSMSVDEMALLLGLRASRGRGLDVILVRELRSGGERPLFKVYPDGAVPDALARTAVVSSAAADGSGRFPYVLARVFGELLLPRSYRVPAPATLFADPPSEAAGFEALKRVDDATGSAARSTGVNLAGGR